MSQNDSISVSVKKKLNPSRFPEMSDTFASIVGCILGFDCNDTPYQSMHISSDGFLTAREKGDIGYNAFIGSEADLNKNWENLMKFAGLTDLEKTHANSLFARAFKRS